jgi:membrane protein DedA with SNARE-associated domain
MKENQSTIILKKPIMKTFHLKGAKTRRIIKSVDISYLGNIEFVENSAGTYGFYANFSERTPLSYLDRFFNLLDALPNSLLYLLLGVSAFVENIFPPIPGDTITAFGAFLVGTRRLDFMGVYLATTLGSLAGFMSLFWIGSLLGRKFFIEKDYKLFSAQNIIQAEKWFQKYGYFLILFNRFFPGIRSIISLAGGISRLGVFRVALLALISAGAWNLIWIAIGYSLGNNWETVKEKMGHILFQYNMAFLILAALVVLILLLRMIRKRRKTGK